MTTVIYQPKYKNSWAIVIGINEYTHVGRLGYACNDAQAIADLLINDFNFPAENVTLLLDADATKANIMRHFLKHANGNTGADDRLVVFYAGHGHTITGNRGEIGFLIPVDGTIDDISTFIRWDELTRNAELFLAKHVLFVMDACYGGLAITRSLQPGSTRFLKDMLRRYTRQVLTAGKANETVADAGGPIPGHSIFTGHFIEALMGKAAQGDGTITANGVMSYVCEKVSKDIYSRQTPHFGYFEGDGDFIFKAPGLESLDSETVDQDKLIVLPLMYNGQNRSDQDQVIDKVKEYLSEDRHFIKLDELINKELRQTMSLLQENFSANETFTPEAFIQRIKDYEKIIENIQVIISSIAHWGNEKQLSSMKKILSRLAEQNEITGGLVVWLQMRWYPVMLLLYFGGISAIASGKYDMLTTLLTLRVQNDRRQKTQELVIATMSEIKDTNDVFKVIPGHERNHVPRSEYLFKTLQPRLDDLLFLGKSYETLFDRFELLLALVYADFNDPSANHIWGPPGRFAWKHTSFDDSPLILLIKEAEIQKAEWPPIKAGLFGGSYERFKLISNKYLELINRLGWH
ncbi:caspase family protein [Paenibacillus radicis (ex Xue et al. 2023)]|uniref:Caspase family protein n=1 Tax=Paenibacillus radicis (ex Xue et al. 2023) TaxID=2972489 RepID=A0ABT1YJY7_9BACL|nr:caspase family protein [Paenibacillus radicis (ex Xue et al. 2023)]MCR8633481.1 caspase family protein [Paenibacillus radicis (ex Xue et al. 2023)]